jgi:ABC-type Co2+ transport system permease subunit
MMENATICCWADMLSYSTSSLFCAVEFVYMSAIVGQ